MGEMLERAGCLTEDTVDGLFRAKLSPEEVAEVDAHIDRCGTCRVLLSSLAADGEADDEAPTAQLASRIATAAAAELAREEAEGGADEARLATGEVIAERFVIDARIGAGGMAEVYRATDRASGGSVALKVPRTRGTDERARFEREAALLIALDHAGIVKHIAEGRAADGAPFLAMEWLEGEDLAQRLRRAPLGIDETLAMGERIAAALGAASAAGVVHRDVKPSNIYLRGGKVEDATLIDFGIARRTAPGAAAVTRTGVLLGTLGYMAPEQALGAKSASARADVFSLGCVLFECLTGRRAFHGAHAVEVLANVLQGAVPRARALAPQVPPALDALVARMLARDPEARPADGAAVAAELARIRAGDAGEADDAAPARFPRRAALAAVALAALVGGPLGWRARHVGTPRDALDAVDAPAPASAPLASASPASPASPATPAASASAPASPTTPAASGSAPHESARAWRPPRAASAPLPPSAPALPPAASADPFGASRN